jgi:hypothetical protein
MRSWIRAIQAVISGGSLLHTISLEEDLRKQGHFIPSSDLEILPENSCIRPETLSLRFLIHFRSFLYNKERNMVEIYHCGPQTFNTK